MKTITKSLVLSSIVILFALPFTQTADAAVPVQKKQVTTHSDFQRPSINDTIKQNVELFKNRKRSYCRQEKHEKFASFSYNEALVLVISYIRYGTRLCVGPLIDAQYHLAAVFLKFLSRHHRRRPFQYLDYTHRQCHLLHIQSQMVQK